jgi:hypothetical protein
MYLQRGGPSSPGTAAHASRGRSCESPDEPIASAVAGAGRLGTHSGRSATSDDLVSYPSGGVHDHKAVRPHLRISHEAVASGLQLDGGEQCLVLRKKDCGMQRSQHWEHRWWSSGKGRRLVDFRSLLARTGFSTLTNTKVSVDGIAFAAHFRRWAQSEAILGRSFISHSECWPGFARKRRVGGRANEARARERR